MILHFLQFNMMAEGKPKELAEFIKQLGVPNSEKNEEQGGKGSIFEDFLDDIAKAMKEGGGSNTV